MPVRLLHTADWHLGATLRWRSRAAEEEAVLAEIVAIAERERVDAVLIAGDIWHSRMPAPEAHERFYRTVLALHERGIRVVAIGGNHDSEGLLVALTPLLGAVGTTMVPRVVRPDEGSLVRVAARDNSAESAVLCLPFVPERRFGTAVALFESAEAWFRDYQQGVARVIGAFEAAFPDDTVNVLMGHLYTGGALLGGGEREVTIGVQYAISPAQLPVSASYIALGHLHRPQRVSGTLAHARYAGSLLQLDFGEREQTKSVTVVEARPGLPAEARVIPLTSGRGLLDLEGTLDEVIELGHAAGDAFLRVRVRCDGPTPGLADRVREALPDALEVKLLYERVERAPDGPSIASLGPRDQFASYYRKQHAAEPPAEVVAALEELLAEREVMG